MQYLIYASFTYALAGIFTLAMATRCVQFKKHITPFDGCLIALLTLLWLLCVSYTAFWFGRLSKMSQAERLVPPAASALSSGSPATSARQAAHRYSA